MEWICVKERLPEPCVDVLAFYPLENKIDISWVYGDGSWAFPVSKGYVSHWMPLPDPPTEE